MNYLTVLVGMIGALAGAFFSVYSAIGVPLCVILLMWCLAYKSEAGMIPAILFYYVLPPYVTGVGVVNIIMYTW
jgi:ABC-type antimicrobial peptide transport system permease subunit